MWQNDGTFMAGYRTSDKQLNSRRKKKTNKQTKLVALNIKRGGRIVMKIGNTGPAYLVSSGSESSFFVSLLSDFFFS